ncbi:unnamed protein product [Diamesa serratosioi]
MVLCNFFLNGSCRYGSKCLNDHIDLKQLIQSEVQAVINGKQYLLSCFGPFKEAPSIPDFIEDQSFEELRFQFQEASKNNLVPNYQMQLQQQYADANNKLQSLKNMTPDIVHLISNIYNKSGDTKAPVVSAQSSNVFANTSNLVQSNPFQTQQPQIPTNQMSTGNIFGASSSTFGSSTTAGNIFGQPQQQQQPSTASIFGTSFSNPAPSGNIFGAPSTNTTSSSFSFVQAAPQNSMLGISAPTTNSIFGGSSTNTSNPFAAAPFNQPQQQPTFATQQSTFGVQQPAFTSQLSQPLFAAPQSQQQHSIFSTPGFAPQPTNVFNSQPTMPSNPFMSQSQAPLVPQQNAPPQNIFNMAQQDPGIPPASIFSIQQPQQQQQQQQQQNPFAGSVFSQTQQQQQQQQKSSESYDESNYSKIEDLLPQELEAYQAEPFIVGNIPTAPPSRSMCLEHK